MSVLHLGFTRFSTPVGSLVHTPLSPASRNHCVEECSKKDLGVDAPTLCEDAVVKDTERAPNF